MLKKQYDYRDEYGLCVRIIFNKNRRRFNVLCYEMFDNGYFNFLCRIRNISVYNLEDIIYPYLDNLRHSLRKININELFEQMIPRIVYKELLAATIKVHSNRLRKFIDCVMNDYVRYEQY